MLQAGLDLIPEYVDDAHFNVLSVYPGADRRLNRDDRVDVVPAKPWQLMLMTPLALVGRVLPPALKLMPALRALKRSDLLIDMGGISFVDGRGGMTLTYNVACILPALILGKKVLKYSQALGPFHTSLNRLAARLVLPRVAINVARGDKTLEHTQQLGLTNVELCADAAFAMVERQTAETEHALVALSRFNGRRMVGIAASSVVREYANQHGVDYCQVLAQFIDQVTAENYGVWLIAHAVRKSQKGGRTSDVETCEAIYDLIQHKSLCQMVTEDYSPSTLRTIIGESDFFVASRLHAMVSSLAKGVPTLVTSWSHKYREVLDMFGLGEWTVNHQSLTTKDLLDGFHQLVEQEDEVRARIARHLPDVIASSRRNAEIAGRLLESVPRSSQKTSFADRLMMRVEKRAAVPDEQTLERYLGPVSKGYLGYAADESIRDEAASGGAVSAILIDLLERGVIVGALVSRAVVRDGEIGAESFIARTREEILSARSSIYMEFPMNAAFQLLAEEPGRLAVVALPCHIQNLRRREARDAALAEKIKARIALVCGRSSSKELLDRVMAKQGILESEVVDMRFRQGHWRGKMRFDLRSGERAEFPFQRFSVYRNLHFGCETRCLYCEDPLGEGADVVCGDAWLWELKSRPVKHSLILARTPEAAGWIDSLIARGHLLAEPASPEMIFRAQRRTLIPAKRGKAAKARLSKLFGYKMSYAGPWKARWNDYLSAAIILFNSRWSQSRSSGLIYKLPRPLLQAYLVGLSFLKDF